MKILGFGFWILDFKRSWILIGFLEFIQKNPNPRKNPSKSKLDPNPRPSLNWNSANKRKFYNSPICILTEWKYNTRVKF